MGSQKRPRLIFLSSPPSTPSSSNQRRRRVPGYVPTLSRLPNPRLDTNQKAHGEVDGVSHHASEEMFVNSQAPDGPQNSQNEKTKETRKMTGESTRTLRPTTPDLNFNPGSQSSFGFTRHPFKPRPTSRSFSIDIFGSCSSASAPPIGRGDFSAPVDGIIETEGISMAANGARDFLNHQLSELPPPIGTSGTRAEPLEFDLNEVGSTGEEDPADLNEVASTGEEDPADLDLDLHL